MKVVFINEDLQGKKLNELLLFVGRKSNKLSLSRYYYGKLTREEFNQMLEQDIEHYNSLEYEEFQLECEEFYNEKYRIFNAKTVDFLYTKFTRKTPVTEGPLFEMCYFIMGDIFRKLMSNMSKLFVYPHEIEGTEFEDLTFYKEERIILAICAHEHFAYMNLEDEEYEELLKLNISHEVKE